MRFFYSFFSFSSVKSTDHLFDAYSTTCIWFSNTNTSSFYGKKKKKKKHLISLPLLL